MQTGSVIGGIVAYTVNVIPVHLPFISSTFFTYKTQQRKHFVAYVHVGTGMRGCWWWCWILRVA